MPVIASLLVNVGAKTGGAELGISQLIGRLGKGGGLVGAAAMAVEAVAGIGIASIKMAGDFQQGITQLETGAGELPKNINLVRQGILGLATSTGTSTQQLLAGMFMIESGGHKGADGLKVLEAAAEGAKVGNADLGQTATAVIGIMNNYKSAHISAAQATNILTATVQDGLTHMQDLAGAMPNVLSTAAATGVSMTDVAAAMATMTSQTVPAANASTYLRQMLISLDAPAKAGQKALADIGLTTSDISASMKKSLPGTLQMIMTHLAETYKVGSPQYVEALKNIAGGSKQMQGMLDLTGDHLKTFQGDVTDISGKVKTAGSSIMGWSDVQGDFNFKIDKAKEVVETFMIKLGTGLLPIAGKLVDFFSNNVAPVLSQFADFISQNAGPAVSALGQVFSDDVLPVIRGFGQILTGTLVPALKKAYDTIAPTLIPAIKQLGQFIATSVLPAVRNMANIFAQNIMPALSQFAAFIIAKVLPVIESLVGWFLNNVEPVLMKVQAIILQNVIPVFESIFITISTKVVPALEKIWNIVAPKLIPVLQFLGSVFKNQIGPAVNGVIGFIGGLIDYIAKVVDWGAKFLAGFSGVKDFLVNILSPAISGIGTALGDAFSIGAEVIKAPFNIAISAVNALISALDSIQVTIPSWVPFVGGDHFGINIPQIPALAQGGDIVQSGYVIVGDAGPELLHLPAGAQVAPLTHPSAPTGLPAGMQTTHGAMSATAGGITIPVTLVMDNKKMGQAIIKVTPDIIRNATGARNF